MARASRPLLGDLTAAGRFRMGRLLVRMSQELAAAGEGSEGRLEAAYTSDSHCMASRLLPTLLVVVVDVVDVEERLRRGGECRRASARAAF